MDLNALHPFREGNGRTIRFYLQLLVNNAGYLLDYSEANHEEIIEADKQAFLGNDKFIKKMYNKIVEKIDEESVENLVAWPLFWRKSVAKSVAKNGAKRIRSAGKTLLVVYVFSNPLDSLRCFYRAKIRPWGIKHLSTDRIYIWTQRLIRER